MHYVIDGYNLLHALGVLPARAGPGGLEKARRGLLGLLHGAYGAQGSDVTIVFDAAGAPAGASGEDFFHGIHIRFAVREEEADDLIEDLIRHDSTPKQLTVVSDDHRIQQAARRRHCVVQGCGDFLDELQRRRKPRAGPPEESKPSAERDKQRWLDTFADLDDDLKEFGFDFEDDDEVKR